MPEFIVRGGTLSGTISPPPSKSHTHRALLFGMMGKGETVIHRPLLSPDTLATMHAITQFGAEVKQGGDTLFIQGGFSPASDVIQVHNSGIAYRFLTALSALLPTYTVLTGDESIRTRRPITPLLSALEQLGAFATGARGDGKAPILVRGPIRKGICHLDGADSQPVSALLIATSFLEGATEIFVENPGEKPWIDLTLSYLERLGAKISSDHYRHYRVEGALSYSGFTMTIPADFSSAAFLIGAALVTQSTLCLSGLDPNDGQGDKKVIEHLQNMGASLFWDETGLQITPSSELRGTEIDINETIDALPLLAVIATFASTKTLLYNGAIARKKESDRIASIASELKKMGAKIEEREDGLLIFPSPLRGARVQSHNDHRIGLALAIAGLGAKGETLIVDTECTAKTYPTFVKDLQLIGANIESDPVRV